MGSHSLLAAGLRVLAAAAATCYSDHSSAHSATDTIKGHFDCLCQKG